TVVVRLRTVGEPVQRLGRHPAPGPPSGPARRPQPDPPIPGTHHNHVTGAHRAPLTAAHRDLVTGPEPEGFGVDPDRPRLDPSEGPAVASHPPGVRSGDHRNRLAETCHPNHDALHGNGLLDAGSTPYPAEKVSADRLSGRGEREIDRVVP